MVPNGPNAPSGAVGGRDAPGGGRPELPLLSFASVHKGYRDGPRTVSLLHDVSFELWQGHSLGIYGAARSGKSTLLRLAASIESPDSGSVRFEGVDVHSHRPTLLRGPIALLTPDDRSPAPPDTVMDQVAIACGAASRSLRQARRAALAALDRVGGASLSALPSAALSASDRALVSLACALVREPRVLLVDEPAPLPSILDRERFCALLRDVSRERHIALLVASEDMSTLQGLSTLASLASGELCLADQPPKVVPFPHRPAAGEGW